MDPLISDRLIDYIRVHVSQMGGLTPAARWRLGEAFGVRTAWHGPATFRPSVMRPTSTLDLASYNFGIQEYSAFGERPREVFCGCPR